MCISGGLTGGGVRFGGGRGCGRNELGDVLLSRPWPETPRPTTNTLTKGGASDMTEPPSNIAFAGGEQSRCFLSLIASRFPRHAAAHRKPCYPRPSKASTKLLWRPFVAGMGGRLCTAEGGTGTARHDTTQIGRRKEARRSTHPPIHPPNHPTNAHLSEAARPRQGRRRRRQRPMLAAVAPERIAVRRPRPGSAGTAPVGRCSARYAARCCRRRRLFVFWDSFGGVSESKYVKPGVRRRKKDTYCRILWDTVGYTRIHNDNNI